MEYRNQSFTEGDIELDGHQFIQCTFRHCTMIFEANGPVTLSHCTFDAPNIEFRGAASRTLAFMRDLYHGGFQSIVEKTFQDIRESDPAPPR